MIKLYTNSIDQSAYLNEGSLSIIDQIQNKSNTAYFTLMSGVATPPEENQEVLIYDTVTLVSASGTAVVVNDKLASGVSIMDYGKYRVDQYFWLDIGGGAEERVEIDAIAEGATGQVNITLKESIINAHAAGEDCGRLIFGGTLTYVKQSSPKLITEVEYQLSATDFTKIFDKKLLNDSWEDVGGRYIINDALNTTINYNKELDDMDYDDDAAVQAEWIESGDGDNPTRNTTDHIQGSSSVDFNWTNSGGTATFEATPSSSDFSELTGAASGAPTEGNITFWYKRSLDSDLTTIAVRVGSDSSNYTTLSFTPKADEELNFISLKLVDGTETGTPDWTAVDYLAFIFTETATASIMIDDVRMTDENSFTMYNFEDTVVYDDVRSAYKKPTSFIDALAGDAQFYWYIDYERDIHFFDRETNEAAFSIHDTSDNFEKLVVDIDTSQLKNRQTVRGGTKTTTTFYYEVKEGDNAAREWVLKSQTANLEITIDDNSSTDTMEAATTTTNVEATAHGLVDDDYIVNRTRSNAVRKITKVDDDNFTVEAVTGQTNGDTFSKFDTTKTVGVEFLVDETTVDYVSNYNEKSVRATDSEATLEDGDFIKFKYNEIIPIRVRAEERISIASMKAILGGDGVFDGAVITDKSLESTQAARERAQAEIEQYANPIVKISFTTNHEGLESGQLLSIVDTNKGIDDEYVIQKVKATFKNGADFPTYDVQAASSLFGIIEYFQKLSETESSKLIDSEEEIDVIVDEYPTITITEANTTGADESASEAETITVGESNSDTLRDVTTDPYKWQVDPSGNDTKWNLFQWM